MAIIPPHYSFTLVFPSPLLPLQTGEKTYSILLLLNCMTSSMPGTKSRGETCILKRSFAQSSFIMYIYANHTLDYSRKVSVAPPLAALWSVFLPAICTLTGSSQSPWLVFFFFFLQKLYKKGKWRFHCSSVTLLKVENERMMNFAKFHQHYLDFCANANELWVSPFKVNCTFPLISQQLFYPPLSYLLHLAY